MDQSLALRMGGHKAIAEMIDQVYYKVIFDKALRTPFLQSDMAVIRKKQTSYLAQMIGCPDVSYEGKDLYEVHKDMGITDKQFDKFCQHMRDVLESMGIAQNIIQDFLALVEAKRQQVVIPKKI